MVEDSELNRWFCKEVLPLERVLMSFIRRNLPQGHEAADIRQEVYSRVLLSAQKELPANVGAYVHTIARNHLINLTRRAKIVAIEYVENVETLSPVSDIFVAERGLSARDELRRVMAALDQLPPRCRQVVSLRKLEGCSIRETAEIMRVSVDTVERQLTLGMRALADFMLGGEGKIKRQGRSTNQAAAQKDAL